ncbi:hypothetical protein P153DRAFT_147866 [Dothidotthia symphoricarpi CBS 119687]|uniref:Uncharacterized protein n=1 Tax=Dothidotthia symphoricarpi CBS 119687 TaxID=1392245 RepID=A0A6A5ZXR9_9PLEO|nr:uncharacterized protein P153DRAFT_147866 [Dothidotthia symphoricarpi CBS 119687]KAF2123703.1 hypothetical protein P153DRAFT_147866 [Dothidotthia symphoricarpi CBS 119687]
MILRRQVSGALHQQSDARRLNAPLAPLAPCLRPLTALLLKMASRGCFATSWSAWVISLWACLTGLQTIAMQYRQVFDYTITGATCRGSWSGYCTSLRPHRRGFWADCARTMHVLVSLRAFYLDAFRLPNYVRVICLSHMLSPDLDFVLTTKRIIKNGAVACSASASASAPATPSLCVDVRPPSIVRVVGEA